MAAVFLSHAGEDKSHAQELKRRLEDRDVEVFIDVDRLRAGDRLLPELERAVGAAGHFVLLLTPHSMASQWVRREVQWALAREALGDGYRVVILVQGLGIGVARWVTGREDTIVIPVDGDVVPELMKALGRMPLGVRGEVLPAAPRVPELVLRFEAPIVKIQNGRTRVHARCGVELRPVSGAPARGRTIDFEAPIGPIEQEEIRWYVERYPLWAAVEDRGRAAQVERDLRVWGGKLWTAATVGAPVADFERIEGERRVVIEVEPGGEGTAALLALPWELLADEHGFLFAGARPVRVLRRLPRSRVERELVAGERLRVLLVLARPDAGFIAPRASLGGLVEALRPLGERVELKVLEQGTWPALLKALEEPWHVVHFDGHGVYDPRLGLGQLVFEAPVEAEAQVVPAQYIDAKKLGEELRNRRVPLIVLEACQSAQADVKVEASVAAALVLAGVGSVVAMTHSVLVTTGAQFTREFYTGLAQGKRIGTAMVRAQQALRRDTRRTASGSRELRVEDWFVPVLYQEEGGDLAFLAGARLPDPADEERRLARVRGRTPAAPRHGFVGRGRELLRLSRLLVAHRVVGIVARGGEGKTTLAAEAALWLLDTGRVDRLCWVNLEIEVALDAIGGQVVAGWKGLAVHGDEATLLIEKELRARRWLVVFDNLESALDASGAWLDPGLGELIAGLPAPTRTILTSRQRPVPDPATRHVELGQLRGYEARELVAGVLREAGLILQEGGAAQGELDPLIQLVGGHARSLVLLTPLVAARGLTATREALVPLIAELEARSPGQRENSLLASVRLSLSRLSEVHRRQVAALQVFHGCTHYVVLAGVLEVEPEEAMGLCRALLEVGLASAEGPWLLVDPALGPAVAGEGDRVGMEGRWLGAC